jgi:photosystem II stability/assembly factor-like uncharacterized protein
MRFAFFVILSAATALAQWQMQESHTKESLRGIGVVDENDVWASGTHGTYLLTTDGGKTWTAHQVSGAADLDFRGVKAFGTEAFLLAAGPGDKSRVYHKVISASIGICSLRTRSPKGSWTAWPSRTRSMA